MHKTNSVKEKLQQQGIKVLYNVPYMPDLNGCESCLSKVKNTYKREKLKHIVKDEEVDYVQLIEESVNSIEKRDIVNAIQGSLRLINK